MGTFWGGGWGAAAAVSAGAALGALLRWRLGELLNHWLPGIPPGTWVANVVGGYGVGLALALIAQHPEWSPQVRLFIVTGVLGGLTTFSTFSAEVWALLQQGRPGWALAAAAAHLAGSLLATAAGWVSADALRRAFNG